MNPRFYPFALTFDIDDHAINDLTKNGFAVCVLGTRRIPERRDITSQFPNPFLFIRRERFWLLTLESAMLLFQISLETELLFPCPFQGPRHQPVLWLYGVILTRGTLHLVRRAFEPLTP
jgi:hypothetical protein